MLSRSSIILLSAIVEEPKMISISEQHESVTQSIETPAPFELEACGLRLEGHSRVQVVGGGFSGTLSVIRLLQLYTEKATDSGVLTIEWFDARGSFFRGLPYQHQQHEDDDGVFILNQPASRMSPFAEDPGHFSRWLEAHVPGANEHTFVTRALYGDYLEDCCHQALYEIRQQGGDVHLNLHFTKAEHQLIRDGNPVPCILALGHHDVDSFSHLRERSEYISRNFDVEAYREALYHVPIDGDVIIIGGGASMIDAIRACEHSGFQGRYLIVSRNTALPWQFDPVLYHPDRDNKYRCRYFSEELYDRQPEFRALVVLLRKEVARAKEQGYGPGHVYGALDVESVYQAAETGTDGEGLRRFAQYLTFLNGTPTPPENVQRFRELRKAGRVQFIKGTVSAEEVRYDESLGGFAVPVNFRHGSETQYADVLINAARFSKRREVAIAQHHESTFGDQESMFFVGPSSPQESRSRSTWGVESFRDEILEVAHQALRFSTLQ